MPDLAQRLAARVGERFEGRLSDCRVHAGQVTIVVPSASLLDVCGSLRDEDDFKFEQLMDLCAVDYLEYGQVDWQTSESATGSGFSRGVQRQSKLEDGAPESESESESERYAVVYHLLSLTHNHRLRVRAFAEGDPPRLPSIITVWNSADWYEREAFDLFGVLFEGHPDLRRLLTDYGFIGHPFRKNFPLSGEVEVRFDPEKSRVVYEPVTIEPRTLVPRVIRRDARYQSPVGEDGTQGEGE